MVQLLVVKNVMFLLVGSFIVLCLSITKPGRTAGARARGLRGHFETVLLGSEVGKVVPLPDPAFSELKQHMVVYSVLCITPSLCPVLAMISSLQGQPWASRAPGARTGSLGSRYSKV